MVIFISVSFDTRADYVAAQPEVTDQQIQDAQAGLLEAKAHYTLRNNITESVLIANPILKAVHASLNSSTIER